ncbi:MAG: HD domain-containing protein [Candidatus Aminicenantes bacterium]|nr:HD domain-containing protein [Candidatus Aminicenantes bacterium]
MDIEKIGFLRRYFKEYVCGYYGDDSYVNKNVKIKEEHTFRVCSHIIRIAESLSLEQEDVYIAEAAALFHDIGRFEQFRRYQTFNDSKSKNHAELGVEVLEQGDWLANLKAAEREIILKAVKFHNARDLPAGESEAVIFFLKLLKDADKLDILEVLTNYYSSDEYGSNPALELDLPSAKTLSEAVVKEIMESKPVNAQHVKSPEDFRILQLSWVFDINFGFALRYINEHRFVDKILTAFSNAQIPGIEKIRRHVKSHLSSKIP